jgi:predicted amidohydrolase YtcJ
VVPGGVRRRGSHGRGPRCGRPGPAGFLSSSDHHDAWVNTAALALAGVDTDTPDLPDVWLIRDEDGRPHGTLREAAMALVGDHLPTTREEHADALRHAQRFLRFLGITGFQAHVHAIGDRAVHDALDAIDTPAGATA